MKNLDQIRAAAALNFWANHRLEDARGEKGSDLFCGLAASLLSRGLLATIAWARDPNASERRSACEEIMLELGRFMAGKDCALLPFPVVTTDDLLRGLTNQPSSLLQQATAEAIAYLGFVKRLRPK